MSKKPTEISRAEILSPYTTKLSPVLFRDIDLQSGATPESVTNQPAHQRIKLQQGMIQTLKPRPSLALSLLRLLGLLALYGAIGVGIVLALAGRLR